MRPRLQVGFREVSLLVGTRRQTLAALIAVLTGAGAELAAAKRRNRRRKRCRGGKKRCGRRCVPGTCCPGTSCGSAEPNCRCARSTEGRTFCQTGGVVKVDPCASSADCGSGEACIPDGQGPGAFCVPSCGFML